MRNLTKTIALVSLLVPTNGYPLGIGEIKLHSALNQNLDAEISLDVSAGEHIDDIKVKLASPDKFEEAGITWSFFLSKIKFEKVSQTDDLVNIKLTTYEVLKEPFLDFMIEVTWPKGTLYREFTVLLDPPATYQQAVAPVTVIAETGAEKVESATKQVVTAVDTVKSQPAVQAESVVTQTMSKNGDSLWKVAERVNDHSDVVTEQMIVALYEANPRAFYKRNINALMAGKMLTVPDKEEILKISRHQALSEYSRQNKVWHSRIRPVSENKPKRPTVAPEQDEIDTQLTLLAPTEAEIAENVVVAASEQEDSSGDANAQVDESSVSIKSPEADSSETTEMELRLERLEQQLQMMQKMLALKDAQIAALQNRKHTDTDLVAATEPTLKDKVPQETSQPELKAENKLQGDVKAPKPSADAIEPSEQKPAVVPDVVTPVKPEVKPEQVLAPIEGQDKVDAKVSPVATPGSTKPEIAKPADAQAKPKDKIKKRKRIKPVEPKSQSGSDTELFTWAIAGGSLLILAALGGVWWRKRKTDAQSTTESMFATTTEINLPESADDEDLTIPIIENSANFNIGTTGESSFIGDFSLATDFDSFEADQTEVDPVSEADVYLAYGRYLQAEELMRQAVIDQPERDECKLKLLEILYANEDIEAFDEYANKLAEEGKQDDVVFWGKLLEMRAEISPETELVIEAIKKEEAVDEAVEELEVSADVDATENESQLTQAEPAEFEVEDGVDSVDFDFSLNDSIQDILSESTDTDAFNIETKDITDDLTVGKAEAETSLEDSLDLDSESSILDVSESDTSTADEENLMDNSILDLESDDLSLDFDLDEFSFENAEDDKALEVAGDNQLDFDLDNFSLENAADDKALEVADDNQLDFDLATEIDEAGSLSESSASEEIETIDFDLDLSEDSPEAVELLDDGLELDDSLDSLTLTPDATEGAVESPEPVVIDEDNVLDDFNLDLGFLGDDSNERDSTFDVDDLTDMDELETKLDLAKAYIDMGDKEAAESLAQEVLVKGNEKQKAVAQFILDGLD